MKNILHGIISFFVGALVLVLLSAIQKMIAGYPLALKGFYIPIGYGGVVGVILGQFMFSLIREKEKLQLISDFANDWEYWQNAEGMILYTSPSCRKITGYSPEEFTDNPGLLDQIIHQEDMAKWQEHNHYSLDSIDTEPLEFRIRRKDGSERWIHHVCRQIQDRKGRFLGVRSSNRDITELKKLEKEVRVLKGFLPICASCKKIRDDQGYWQQIEEYIRKHSEAEFSHSICPECAKKSFPEFKHPDKDEGKDA